MPMSKGTLIASIGCGTCILIIGITCLVLGLQGYFSFNEPCMIMDSMQMDSFELGSPDSGESSGNALLNVANALTGGLASQLTPSNVQMTMSIIVQVNNTNPFDLSYKQDGEGKVYLVADNITGLEEDVEIGDWTIPDGTLESKDSNLIPITMNALLEFNGQDSATLIANFVTGGPMSFRITGGITGEGWVPALSGDTTFICIADMDNVATIGAGANVRCRMSTNVAGVTSVDSDFETSQSFFEPQQVDPSCYV